MTTFLYEFVTAATPTKSTADSMNSGLLMQLKLGFIRVGEQGAKVSLSSGSPCPDTL